MSVDRPCGHVRIPTPDGEQVLVDPRIHREDVVRRLLLRGVTVATLVRLLPEWAVMIDRVHTRVCGGASAGSRPSER